MARYYKGDWGTEVLVDTESPIETATVKQLLVRKPSGKEVTWDATVGPMNAQGEYTTLRYIIQAGDWDESGFYTLQAYVVLPSGGWHGETVKFEVKAKFK